MIIPNLNYGENDFDINDVNSDLKNDRDDLKNDLETRLLNLIRVNPELAYKILVYRGYTYIGPLYEAILSENEFLGMWRRVSERCLYAKEHESRF